MNRDNKVFVAKTNKKINNNETVYSSMNPTKEETSNQIVDNRNIEQKIRDIFNSRNYIYKADVIIKTNKETLTKRIIGRNSKYLITNENELIPIDTILDIKYQ